MKGIVGTLAACVVVASFTGCATGSPPTTPGDAGLGGASPPAAPRAVTLGLPYRPDVQFTPIYVALAGDTLERAGLDVRLEYGDEASFVRLVAAGRMDAVIASGEQVILARADGIPVTYVMTWYARFPGVVFSLDPEIDEPAALVGHKVGLPAPSGASYIGWQALLAANGIDATAVTTEIVGFEQLSAVLEHRVDAAVGYAANEPVQLRADGIEPSVIGIADSFNLVSNGLVVSQEWIAQEPDIVQGLVDGLLQGIADTLDDPDTAFGIALEAVPEAADERVRARQRQVLDASMRYWYAPELGAIDKEAWHASQAFLEEIGLISSPTEVDVLVDDRFVRRSGAVKDASQP